MSFDIIPTEGVRTWWPWVRACLYRLLEKSGSDEWWPEDVFRELAEGRCTLILARDEPGHPVGFTVIQINRDVVGPYLYVWIIYAPGQAQGRPLVRRLPPRGGKKGGPTGRMDGAASEGPLAVRGKGANPADFACAVEPNR